VRRGEEEEEEGEGEEKEEGEDEPCHVNEGVSAKGAKSQADVEGKQSAPASRLSTGEKHLR
jgi:hypothetical protein